MWRILILLVSLACVGALAGCNRNQVATSKEDPTIIFRSEDGRVLTQEDLKGFTGNIRWEIVGGENVPPQAHELHQQARQFGEKGDYTNALVLLERASALPPRWPYPVYDRAYTHLLMKDYDGAREFYRKTVELSRRGFFTAITALDTLEREHKGDLPAGTYLMYLSLEWQDDPEKRAAAVRQLAKQFPKFAPAWKELAACRHREGIGGQTRRRDKRNVTDQQSAGP
ncbi:MAG: hypothetical protein C5B50_17765 [Verrucomicrobia bacterium]|nr:MAG: hypothetical protein C5B50_17765 [Verrucomicrobiota bacterium]